MFVIQCALKRLLYNKKISLIFILSIAAGLIHSVHSRRADLPVLHPGIHPYISGYGCNEPV